MRTRQFSPVLLFLIASASAIAQVQQPDAIFKSAHDNITAVDPFDVGTGIYYREYEDLFVKDTIPIDLIRTQRTLHPSSRPCGVAGRSWHALTSGRGVSKFAGV